LSHPGCPGIPLRPDDPVLAAPDYPAFRRLLAASGCVRCRLSLARTSIVVDRGNPAAGLMAVGEGPGAEEDAAGRAFVGRSGKLLDRMMAAAGIDSERDVLIANVVKCRPPGNRPPSADEAAACLPYLRRQIELVRPRLVLLLGATAARHFHPGRLAPMGEALGRHFENPDWPGITFVTLYHPAYILRDPRRRPMMEAHLRAIAAAR
jgi:DNA polymerase